MQIGGASNLCYRLLRWSTYRLVAFSYLVFYSLLMTSTQKAQSISKTVVNFLTAMATVNNGVREILPFIRYISQFLEFEFNTIQGQNEGLGVVCAATW